MFQHTNTCRDNPELIRVIGTAYPGSDLIFEVVTDPQGLQYHARQWDLLSYNLPHAMPMTSAAWQICHINNIHSDDRDLHSIFIYISDDLVGVLPLLCQKTRRWGRLSRCYTTPHSSVDILSWPGMEDTIMKALSRYLNNKSPRFDYLKLRMVPADSPSIKSISSQVKFCRVIRELGGYCSYLNTAGEYSEYTKRQSSRFRRNLRRVKRNLSRAGKVNLKILTGLEADPEVLDDFIRMECSGWKGRAGSALECQHELMSFYRDLVPAMQDLGWLRWHLLELDGAVIAAQLAIQMHGTQYIVKIAYDEKYAGYSPGNILMDFVIEKAFTEIETRFINCITCFPWNYNWLMEKYPYYNFFLYPRRLETTLFRWLPHTMINTARGLYNRYFRRFLPFAKTIGKTNPSHNGACCRMKK